MSQTSASGAATPPPARTRDAARRGAVLLAIAAFLFVAAFRGLYVPLALGQDEGDYSAATMQALTGQTLYGEQHSVRPPVLYAYYAAAYRFHQATGVGLDVTVHVLAALLAAASIALLASALARRFSLGAAVAGTTLAALLACSPPLQAIDANAESLMLLPYTAAGLLMWRWARGEELERPMLEAALAGALTVFAIMTKQVAGVLVFLLVVALIVRRRDAARLLGSFVGAAALTAGAFVVWVAATGQFAEWIVFGWLQNFMYAANAAGAERSRIASESLYRMRVLVGLPLGTALVAGVWPRRDDRPEDRATMWFALAWIALSALAVSASGFFFPHYFIQLVPALGLMGALAADRILRFSAGLPRRTLSFLAAAVLLAVLLGGPGFHAVKALASYPTLPLPTDQGLKPGVGAWVKSLTAPSDRVLAYTPLRGVNVYADRLPANAVSDGSLFALRTFTVYGKAAGSRLLGITLVEPRNAIVAQWAASPPDAVLVMMPRTQPLGSSDNANERELDAALKRLLGGYRSVVTRRFGSYDALLYRIGPR